MKKLSVVLLFLLLGVFLVAGSAWALNIPYWTLTDHTTGYNGESTIQLILENPNASYESDFGLFAVDYISSPSSVTKLLPVFSYDQEAYSATSVWFYNDSGTWRAIVSETAGPPVSPETWAEFDNQFGFYFAVHTGVTEDTSWDYMWFSDPQFNRDSSLNSVDTDLEHVSAVKYLSGAKVVMEDRPGHFIGDGGDPTDMTVTVNDVAPVPEPATMLLFGVGLCGLAFVGRKKLIRHG